MPPKPIIAMFNAGLAGMRAVIAMHSRPSTTAVTTRLPKNTPAACSLRKPARINLVFNVAFSASDAGILAPTCWRKVTMVLGGASVSAEIVCP